MIIMRRSDREVTEIKDLLDIIASCKVCRLALQDADGLYIVPLNFGYEYADGKLLLYFHSAKEGRKINAITQNNDVCFEMDCDHRLIEADAACSYGFAFKSIIGNGTASIVGDIEEKKKALELLMQHQTGKEFSFHEKMINAVTVFKVDVVSFTGKYHR